MNGGGDGQHAQGIFRCSFRSSFKSGALWNEQSLLTSTELPAGLSQSENSVWLGCPT
jgi:hypothetical protein